MEEEQICKNCEVNMREVGGTGKDVQIMKWEGAKQIVIGVREQKLYQCMTCKRIEVS